MYDLYFSLVLENFHKDDIRQNDGQFHCDVVAIWVVPLCNLKPFEPTGRRAGVSAGYKIETGPTGNWWTAFSYQRFAILDSTEIVLRSALNNSTFEVVQECIKSTILWLRWSLIMLWKVLTFDANWIDPSYHMYDLYSLFRPWLCKFYSVPGGSCISYLRSAYKTHNSHIIAQLIIQLILQKCLLFAN